jgi:hypothetical protein
MLDKLKKHHIGIIVSESQCDYLANKYKKTFNLDEVQGTRVMFVYDEDFKFYREYIVKEGRVKNMPLGFAHICYSLESKAQFEKVESYISQHKLGYPVTKLEESASIECGWVKFYFIKNCGLVELNLVE